MPLALQAATKGVLVGPASGSVLPGSAVTFTWSTGSGVAQYQLWLGTAGVGSGNLGIHSVAGTTAKTASVKVGGLPTTGGRIYARLFSDIDGAWDFTDYTFTASKLPAATAAAAALSGISCGSASLTGAAEDTCTVALTEAAPGAGATVTLSSSSSAVKVPATVKVASGSTKATFTATAAAVASAETVTLKATDGSVGKTYALSLKAAKAVLSLSATSLAYGDVPLHAKVSKTLTLKSSGTATLTISKSALTGSGFSVAGATFPLTLTVGKTAALTISYDPSAAGAVSGKLSLTSNSGSGATIVMALTGTGTEASVSGVTCHTATITGAETDACAVDLSSAASPGGLAVKLASSDAAVKVPASITVAAGASSATFNATVAAVTTAQKATLTAASGSVSKSYALTLDAVKPELTLSATSLAFGDVPLNAKVSKALTLKSSGTATLTISKDALTGSGFSVTGATFPLTLTVGKTAALTISYDPTAAGAVSGKLSLTSNSGSGATTSVALTGTGTAAALSAVSCQSATVTGAGSDGCTVGLSSAASPGGLAVKLASSDSAVKVPASITVAAGATTASFTATVAAVTTGQKATLTAASGSVSKSYAVQLDVSSPSLSLSAASLAFGNVLLQTPATQSLVLTSAGSAPLTVSSVKLTGTGLTESGVAFPLTLSPGKTATLLVQFDPQATGAVAGTLTIASNSSTGASKTIAVSGTGESQAIGVDLSWDAPGSDGSIAGYNVYRAVSGSSSYSLLNSSVDASTSYEDKTVTSGTTYNYIVESVSTEGLESGPSNVFAVSVP